ncbi:MAG: hypothetical protein QNJ20_11860 [Paracoccaceae bacterium]|nr:hypothetical protein [Paracoccaceae bacterium]
MHRTPRANLYLGLVCLVFAVAIAGLWVPFDTDSGLLETVRRRVSIGDALAPTIAAFFIGFGGLLLMVSDRNANDQPALSAVHLRFIVALVALLVVVFSVMRWTGPLAVALVGPEEPYRILRDTAPWKWLGFAAGGVLLVTGLIAAIERRMSLRAVLIGLGVVLALIAVFDLPFDDLLLPPNGDV